MLVEVRGADKVSALDLVNGAVRWTVPDAVVASADTRQTNLMKLGGSKVLIAADTPSGRILWHRNVPRSVAAKYGEVNTGVASGRLAIAEVCDSG